jgi:hypothetical protein
MTSAIQNQQSTLSLTAPTPAFASFLSSPGAMAFATANTLAAATQVYSGSDTENEQDFLLSIMMCVFHLTQANVTTSVSTCISKFCVLFSDISLSSRSRSNYP